MKLHEYVIRTLRFIIELRLLEALGAAWGLSEAVVRRSCAGDFIALFGIKLQVQRSFIYFPFAECSCGH